MLLLLELVLVQELSFRDVYSQSNFSMTSIVSRKFMIAIPVKNNIFVFKILEFKIL